MWKLLLKVIGVTLAIGAVFESGFRLRGYAGNDDADLIEKNQSLSIRENALDKMEEELFIRQEELHKIEEGLNEREKKLEEIEARLAEEQHHRDVVMMADGSCAVVSSFKKTDKCQNLYDAVDADDVSGVASLMKGVNDPADSGTRETALHWAVQSESEKVIKFLMLQGADINAKDINGITPLKIAERKKRRKIIRLLKNTGED